MSHTNIVCRRAATCLSPLLLVPTGPQDSMGTAPLAHLAWKLCHFSQRLAAHQQSHGRFGPKLSRTIAMMSFRRVLLGISNAKHSRPRRCWNGLLKLRTRQSDFLPNADPGRGGRGESEGMSQEDLSPAAKYAEASCIIT